jgi:hypothetical protein
MPKRKNDIGTGWISGYNRKTADGPFGKMLPFRDPDGYLITMHDGG